MIKGIASAIGIRGFLAIGLAIVVATMAWKISSLSSKVEKLTTWQKTVTAETADAMGLDPKSATEPEGVVGSLKILRQYREAAERFAAEGLERSQRSADALEQQKSHSQRLSRQAAAIRAAAPATDCRTPQEVLDADL